MLIFYSSIGTCFFVYLETLWVTSKSMKMGRLETICLSFYFEILALDLRISALLPGSALAHNHLTGCCVAHLASFPKIIAGFLPLCQLKQAHSPIVVG